MYRPRLLQTENACWVSSLSLVLAVAFAPRLPGATVITGDVTPALPWSAFTNPKIGITGAGTLAVDEGGTLLSNVSVLGADPGSTGMATITGAGSTWTNRYELTVGGSGSGDLRVEAGGQVSSNTGRLGSSSGSAGTATITGAGSMWTNRFGLTVGSSGSGALRVEAGGQVSSNTGSLGSSSGSTSTATITGAGSTWTNSFELYVRGNGALTVENGGRVTAGTLYASLDDLHGDGTIEATRGAVLDADLHFDEANPAQAVFGFGSGGMLTVTPSVAGHLGAGYSGVGSLTIAEGVAVSSSYGTLGYSRGSTGTAMITGAGSTWTNNGELSVGRLGSGEVRVEAGGQVSNAIGYLGYDNGSTGTVTITGAGSKWTSSSGLAVGRFGSGALRVEAGGEVITSNGDLGFEWRSTGTATITGAGSKWTNSALSVGHLGSGQLRVEAGGQVSSASGSLGSYGSGAATVTGAGSTWTVNSGLSVGGNGTGALTVEDGGHVTAGTLYASLDDLHGDGTIEATKGAVLDADLHFNAANPAQAVFGFGSGGMLTVTAAGGELGAGYKGVGSLTITEGVAVSSSYGTLGYSRGSTGTATITGAGSTWANSSEVRVGFRGSGTLIVDAGGQVNSAGGYVGYLTNSMGTATISGAGSRWTNSSALYVGTGEFRVEAGGQVSSAFGVLGKDYGAKSTATITGAGSMWTINSGLSIGSSGSGAITITSGGLISVRGALTIDSYTRGDSFINMATGGMVALWGDADDSLAQLLDLVTGTDAIRCWNASLADWAPLTAATLGVDYTLQYLDAGDLAGYTLLTVLAPGPPGDFNLDGRVDGADLLAWQRGNSPTPNSPEDLATWTANFGLGAATPTTTAVPEPGRFALVGLASLSLFLGCRSTCGRTRSCTWGGRPAGPSKTRSS